MLRAAMPGGVLEERLRAWVADRLERGTTPRGRQKALADYLGRDSAWVSMYKHDDRDADFDTALAIMRFFNVSLDDLMRDDLPDEIDVLIWELVRPLHRERKQLALDLVRRVARNELVVVAQRESVPPTESRLQKGRKGRGRP